MPLPLFILIAFLLLTLVSGAYIFIIACAKRKDIDWLDEQVVSKTPNAQYYEFMVASDKWLKEHKAQDVYTTGADGVPLHALWIPVSNSKGTVLMAHGYRSTMLLDFHLAFELFHRLGMNILVPEQRTHGQSGGRFITFGVKESADMHCWIRCHNRTLSCGPMILYGISMGASTMLYLADRKLPTNVKGIIADCGFTSPAQIISSVYRSVLHIPPLLSVWAAGLFARVFAGFSIWKSDSRKSLAATRLPVLLIHGEADGFVPCEMTKQAYEACTGKKALLLVKDAEHGLSFLFDGLRYTAMVIDFLKENIPGFDLPGNTQESQ